MITLEWFDGEQHEGCCIVCSQSRDAKNSVFCSEHYKLFRISRQFKSLDEALQKSLSLSDINTEEREQARLEAWVSFANEHRTYYCFCGNERDYDDYLCPSCRESYADAA